MKGSNHPAFVDMNFRWRGSLDLKESLRSVVLPDGFTLNEIDGEFFEIYDKDKYPRAVVKVPADKSRSPAITPIKRFSADTEQVADGWKMLIREWGRVVIRGDVFSSSNEAVESAKGWLNSKRPGWDSYTSRVNFRGNPPRWRLSE